MNNCPSPADSNDINSFEVSVDPETIICGRTVITVKAKINQALASVTSDSGSTITLSDASLFPTKGTATLKDGTKKGIEITWTGRSGNQLTGVSSHTLLAGDGATCSLLPGSNTSYNKMVALNVYIQPDTPGGERIAGTISPLNLNSWSNGIATRLVTIHVPGESDPGYKTIVIEVMDNSVPGSGMRGSCLAYIPSTAGQSGCTGDKVKLQFLRTNGPYGSSGCSPRAFKVTGKFGTYGAGNDVPDLACNVGSQPSWLTSASWPCGSGTPVEINVDSALNAGERVLTIRSYIGRLSGNNAYASTEDSVSFDSGTPVSYSASPSSICDQSDYCALDCGDLVATWTVDLLLKTVT